MDREANLPVPPAVPKNINLPINPDNTTSSSSSFSSSSPPHFLRQVQAAFKRHRPLGAGQSNSIRPMRMAVPQQETLKSSATQAGVMEDTKESQDVVSLTKGHVGKDPVAQRKSIVTVAGITQDNPSITPPSILSTMTRSFVENLNTQRDEAKSDTSCRDTNLMSILHAGSQQMDIQKKVQFSIGSNKTSQGVHDQMATGLGNLSSHFGSLALAEMEWLASNQGEASIINNNPKDRNFQNAVSYMDLRNDEGVSFSAKRTAAVQDQLHPFRNFLSQPLTQSSVVGPSCITTTSVHSTSAPMLNSTTYCPRMHRDSGSHVAVEPLGGFNMNSQPESQGNMVRPSTSSQKEMCSLVVNETSTAVQADNSCISTQMEVKEYGICKEQGGSLLKETEVPENKSVLDDKSTEGKGYVGDTRVQSQVHVPKHSTSDVKLEASKSEKQEKVASGKGTSLPRKRNYDPDLFFKVNGKLYQRLGKIGSGGSSEVHKVISSDCTIHALKKIKLKGRDCGTAYGFCQEIVYLSKLKGKDNIIQLVDYEVTDKSLLREVMTGSMSNKDARVKDDGYIYMVLEYGEIDLAHMLSQKWREIYGSIKTIDENWLRFYWQQILQAVNTIHEERIVHSDLKPANFLLVKGYLKLIDFGIAKAIMSDTTHIQRDSQVGTLSYMSPEAFMCNESDANGNTIKCGRPSDIWSLGCILYQMVYGRTPFSDYKTFWQKFKVITDPNHEISYEPVSNPWLLDLMKKCLAWDPNERWRIPQLLQHPFLVPPVSPQLSLSQDQSSRLLQLIADTCTDDGEALILCRQLQQLLSEPVRPMTSLLITSWDQRDLHSQISKVYLQLRKHLAHYD